MSLPSIPITRSLYFTYSWLKMPNKMVKDISFEHVHRIPRRKTKSTSAAARPVIANFSFFKEEQICKFVKNLKDTKFAVSNDYSEENDEIRKAAYPIFKRPVDHLRKCVLQ